MWYCCPICVGTSQQRTKSVWNDKLGIRIGLEDYMKLVDSGHRPQRRLGILKCPVHEGHLHALPQEVEAEHDRLRKMRLVKKHGGIELEDTRYD